MISDSVAFTVRFEVDGNGTVGQRIFIIALPCVSFTAHHVPVRFFLTFKHYCKIRDFAGAIADFTVVLEREEEPYWYMMRGKAYAGQSNYKNALADCTVAIDLEPDSKGNAITYHDRAYYRAALKDYQGAVEDAERFLAFGLKWLEVEKLRKALEAWQQGRTEE